MAITYTMATACASLKTNHAFLARVDGVTSGTASADQIQDSTVCGNDASCCVVANMKAIVKSEIDEVKATLVAFGTGASKLGSIWNKVASLVNASTITGTTTPAAALEASTESGATGAQWKAFSTYTNTSFNTDFAAFKDQAVTCFDYYVSAIKKIACDGCKDSADLASIPARWKSETTGSITITAASANAWAAACNKVWYFMWKTGWFVQSVAYLNNKKATAAYSAPALTAIYSNSASVTIDNVNSAFEKCSGTLTDTCDATMKANLVKAFVQVFGASTTNFGRGDTTILAAGTFASNGVSRRMLVLQATDGTIAVGDTGFDLVAATKTYPPTTDVTFVAGDTTAWSSGYVASSSSSSSSSTTTKNAKVVIGTILSALFAIAFLN